MAALSTLALQAKGLTSVLQRPKFLTSEARASVVESKLEPTKSLSSSSLSRSSTTTTDESLFDDIEQRPSVDGSASTTATTSRRPRLGSEDSATAVVQLLPWELQDERGNIVEHALVREKVLELTVYRRTFVEDASGEDEYSFQYAVRTTCDRSV